MYHKLVFFLNLYFDDIFCHVHVLICNVTFSLAPGSTNTMKKEKLNT